MMESRRLPESDDLRMHPPSPQRVPRPPGVPLRRIEGCALFRDLPSEQQSVISLAARARTVRRGEVLFRQGETAKEIAVVVRGHVKIQCATGKGTAALVQVLGPAEVCDWPGLLHHRRHSCTVVAAEAGLIVTWDRRRLVALSERHAVMRRSALWIAAYREHELAQRLHELRTVGASQRLARALLRLAGPGSGGTGSLEIPLSRRELGELTGMTPRVVTRLLAGWRRDGLVEARRGRVRIVSPRALAAGGAEPPS